MADGEINEQSKEHMSGSINNEDINVIISIQETDDLSIHEDINDSCNIQMVTDYPNDDEDWFLPDNDLSNNDLLLIWEDNSNLYTWHSIFIHSNH